MRLSATVAFVGISFSLLSIASANEVTKEDRAERPNILYIMSDDHTSQAVGAYGSRLAKLNPTPTIDRLAKEGILFENAFCTNSICSPSRACVLTGQYNHTNGVFDLAGKVLPENQFLAIEMKKAGYHTAMIGKWHLKVEPASFEHYCVLPGQGKYFDPIFRLRGDKPWPKNTIQFKGKHSSDAITDLTLEWLKNGWDQDRPFFLMHHYKAPHDYFEYAPRYEEYLADVEIPEPENMWKMNEKFGSLATRGENDELVPHIGTSIGRRNPRRSYAADFKVDPKLSEEDAKRAAYNIYLKSYLRCVKGVDDNLKRLFDHLEAVDQMDNTLIVYTGDQGFMLGEHDYQDKRWMYEESQRMPFVVRYPKSIPAGLKTDAIIENVDFAPMMLDFAGVKTPEYMQGRSFKEICETGKEAADWKQAAYYRYWMHMAHHDNPGHVGIRTKTHKLIFYYGAGYRKGDQRTPAAWELYDLKNDPGENVNQYDNPEYAGIASSLKRQLKQLREDIGDDGAEYPEIEKVVQDFWDYDEEDKKAARTISNEFLEKRKASLAGDQKK
ncbi:MAG: sulfatase [Mariniblastus sp.]